MPYSRLRKRCARHIILDLAQQRVLLHAVPRQILLNDAAPQTDLGQIEPEIPVGVLVADPLVVPALSQASLCAAAPDCLASDAPCANAFHQSLLHGQIHGSGETLCAGAGDVVTSSIERSFGWFDGFRRLSKDYEYELESSEAMIYAAMSHLLLRHLSRQVQLASSLVV